MKKWIKITVTALVVLVFIGTFVFLYRKSRPKTVTYQILKAEVKDLRQTTVATGKIEPRDEVEIKPQISGIIAEVYKEAGELVRQGEVIAKVKVIPELGTLNSAESRVRLAEMNGRQAETDLERMEKLYNGKLVSSEEYEKSLLAARQAREELQAAKDNLEIVKEGITKNSASFSSTLIRSTIDGLILDVPVKVGNSVIMSNTFNDGSGAHPRRHSRENHVGCLAGHDVRRETGIHFPQKHGKQRGQPVRNQSGHCRAGQRHRPFGLQCQCRNGIATCIPCRDGAGSGRGV